MKLNKILVLLCAVGLFASTVSAADCISGSRDKAPSILGQI